MLTLLDWHPSLAGIFSGLWHIVAEIPTTSNTVDKINQIKEDDHKDINLVSKIQISNGNELFTNLVECSICEISFCGTNTTLEKHMFDAHKGQKDTEVHEGVMYWCKTCHKFSTNLQCLIHATKNLNPIPMPINKKCQHCDFEAHSDEGILKHTSKEIENTFGTLYFCKSAISKVVLWKIYNKIYA